MYTNKRMPMQDNQIKYRDLIWIWTLMIETKAIKNMHWIKPERDSKHDAVTGQPSMFSKVSLFRAATTQDLSQ